MPDAALRRRLVLDPADPGPYAEGVRVIADDRVAFAWFRRLLTVDPSPDGDVLRRAMAATRAVDSQTLVRLANSGAYGDPVVVPFVIAALLVTGRVDLEKLAASPARFADAPDNFVKGLALLSEQTLPGSLAETYQIMIGKQYLSALLLKAGYEGLAARMDLNVSAFTRKMRKAFYGDGPRGFTEHWTFAVGHMVLLAFLVRGQEAGVLEFRGVKVWKGSVANWFLWDRIRTLSRNLEVVPRGSVFADTHSSRNLEWVDGRFVNYFEACGIIADRAGDASGAILQPPAATDPVLNRFFVAAGLGPDDRIVTLHCREAGYRVADRHDLRNVDVASYVPALKALVARGYRVVRLGDRTMTPLPAIDGVVDYAVSPLKSAELDVLLPAVARFHIGSSSGLSLVPLLYGVPTLFLNWYPYEMQPWGRRNWTVMKPLEILGEGLRSTDPKVYGSLGRIREAPLLRQLGFQAGNLRPAEVERFVRDFAESVERDGRAPSGSGPPNSGPNASRVFAVGDDGALHDLP